MSHDRFLAGRAALVTGGASGMGRAIALALAEAGADVAIGSRLSGRPAAAGEIAYFPSLPELERTRQEIEARGVRAIALDLDVCRRESAAGLHRAAIELFGKVDVLVNAAGITVEQTVSEHDDELWLKVIDVNLNGAYRMIKLCLPGMMERRWGRIVNIASTSASVGSPTTAAYSASKAGLVGLTRCVALEGAPCGVTCNAISPGWVRTQFGARWMAALAHAEASEAGAYEARTAQGNPQRRLIQPEEIGALAVFLCRDAALGITMQDLTVSGGSVW